LAARLEILAVTLLAKERLGELDGKCAFPYARRTKEQVASCQPTSLEALPKPLDNRVVSVNALPHASKLGVWNAECGMPFPPVYI